MGVCDLQNPMANKKRSKILLRFLYINIFLTNFFKQIVLFLTH